MKPVNRKTRKAIDKSVRRAMKEHGPALVASLASALASSMATSSAAKAPGKRGTSKPAGIVEHDEEPVKPAKKKARTSEQKPRHRKISSDVGAKE